MSYSAKYASCFYGPFRDALHPAPDSAIRKPTGWITATRIEAIRETQNGRSEGADIVMVKTPQLPRHHPEVKNAVQVPVSAYNISGEYAGDQGRGCPGMDQRRQGDPRSPDCRSSGPAPT